MSPPSKAAFTRGSASGNRSTRSSNRRLDIIRTTARLFVQRGYETTSMGDIATANNISKPGLYYHFESKQELLAAIIDRAHDQLEAGLSEVLDPLTNPRDRLRAAIHAHAIGITKAEDAAYSILAVEEIHSLLPADLERIRRRKRAYVDLIKEILDELVDDDQAYSMDTTAAAYTIAGMVLWIPKWYQAGGRLSAERVADEITNLVVRSIVKPVSTVAV